MSEAWLIAGAIVLGSGVIAMAIEQAANRTRERLLTIADRLLDIQNRLGR